jgi:hypothetical protein
MINNIQFIFLKIDLRSTDSMLEWLSYHWLPEEHKRPLFLFLIF